MVNFCSSRMDNSNQEVDIINKSDLEHIIAELSLDNQQFSVFLEQEEYVDINQMCDSTQEMKHELPCSVAGSSDQNGSKHIEVDDYFSCSRYSSNTNVCPSTGKQLNIVDYTGPYHFEVSLAGSDYKRGSFIYSPKLKKVFIDAGKVMMMKFKVSPNCPLGLQIRALLVYMVPDHMNCAVNRCTLHMFDSDPNHLAHSIQGTCMCQQYNLAGHILTTDNTNAIYEYNPDSERHSVLIPLGQPQPGSDTVTVAYQFGCKTSCPSGMSRRPVKIMFTLETPRGDVLGKQCMSVKVCSCPKRDKEKEENDYNLEQSTVSNNSSKRHHKSSDSRLSVSSNRNVKRVKLVSGYSPKELSPMTINEEINKLCNQLNELRQKIKLAFEQMHIIKQEESDCKNRIF